jgi:hypothetical protein
MRRSALHSAVGIRQCQQSAKHPRARRHVAKRSDPLFAIPPTPELNRKCEILSRRDNNVPAIQQQQQKKKNTLYELVSKKKRNEKPLRQKTTTRRKKMGGLLDRQ